VTLHVERKSSMLNTLSFALEADLSSSNRLRTALWLHGRVRLSTLQGSRLMAGALPALA
jgi:hypothetical protein